MGAHHFPFQEVFFEIKAKGRYFANFHLFLSSSSVNKLQNLFFEQLFLKINISKKKSSTNYQASLDVFKIFLDYFRLSEVQAKSNLVRYLVCNSFLHANLFKRDVWFWKSTDEL